MKMSIDMLMRICIRFTTRASVFRGSRERWPIFAFTIESSKSANVNVGVDEPWRDQGHFRMSL